LNSWNSDEVGVQLSEMKIRFLTTRATIRANLSNDHLTVLITTNATGTQAPPYLLFPGTNLATIPNTVLDSEDCWGNFSPNGWMDVERFQTWMMKFVSFIRKRESDDPTEYSLLILDGHNSRLHPSTMFTAAVHRVICLVGPSVLTNAWQANDSGVNKTFKDNLSVVVAEQVEAKLAFSSADLSYFIQKALQKENMVRSIKNSFSHVGIVPLDRRKIEKMIQNEQPKINLIDTDLQLGLAVSLTHEKLEKLEHLSGEKRKRDQAEKEKKKEEKLWIPVSRPSSQTRSPSQHCRNSKFSLG
jgi:hypothetical protein